MTDDKPVKKRRFRYQIDLGPLSMLIWGLCIFFFLAWIFVLGIFVGRGFLPNDISDLSGLKSEINKLQDTGETRESNSTNPVEKEPELTFYDKLTTKKEEAKFNFQSETVSEPAKTFSVPTDTVAIQQPIAEKKAQDQPPVDEKKAQDQLPVTDKKVQAQLPETDKKVQAQPPSIDKKSSQISAVATTSSGAGKYTIQIASIAELASAEKTVKQLVEKGFNAYYYETKVKGKTYYRIRCGKFSDRAEAVKTALKLQEKTGLKGYVTGSE